eukprot:1897578-Amphidinium_carterae.1
MDMGEPSAGYWLEDEASTVRRNGRLSDEFHRARALQSGSRASSNKYSPNPLRKRCNALEELYTSHPSRCEVQQIANNH